MSFRYVSLILAAVTTLIFIIQTYSAGFTNTFVLVPPDVVERPWILLTSIFLHGSAAHLLGNMFALIMFGMVLDNTIGSRKFFAIYIASGILASFVSTYFYASALGASGAIFGVLGVLAALRPRLVVWTYGVPMPMFVAAAFWLLLDALGVFYPSNIANMAHIAGLIFGVLIGIGMRKAYREAEKSEPKEKAISNEEFDRWEDEWV